MGRSMRWEKEEDLGSTVGEKMPFLFKTKAEYIYWERQ
jgi:hypothetical protein